MAPMAFAYNTALHCLITPFFPSYGIEQTWPKCSPPNFFLRPLSLVWGSKFL
jgi:hypothetical protein